MIVVIIANASYRKLIAVKQLMKLVDGDDNNIDVNLSENAFTS